MTKTNPGRFFEDYTLGEVISHAVPRTVTAGDRAVYQALYPARHALYASDHFAQNCGFDDAPIDNLMVFHIVFGKSVPDISLNAVANLGYAEGRWLAPVHVGDTLSARSEVIGLKENSNGKSGIVYVRTTGYDQHNTAVLSYVRWVMVRKKRQTAAPQTVIPSLRPALAASDLILPQGLDFSAYDTVAAGEAHRWGDYTIGETIDHVDGATLEEAEHMMATRLWQNTAKLHFDTTIREDGRRLIYGGHIISLARALSFNGLANAQIILGLNGGAHANPCFAGDTIRVWSEVLDKAESAQDSVGLMRLRLVAARAGAPAFALKKEDGGYHPDVFLELDTWVAIPR